MSRKEFAFCITAIVYFIACLFGSTAVSSSIAQYIGTYGWSTFNAWSMAIGGVFSVVVLVLMIWRFVLQLPAWYEIVIFFAGALPTAYVLYNFVLLTTELVHLPQFMILTVLWMYAFPRHLSLGILASIICCIGDEWAQSFMPGRVLDVNDIFLNFIGMFFGLVLWWVLSAFRIHEQNEVIQIIYGDV
ncbi:MAG: VanZ family protein [bacterium]